MPAPTGLAERAKRQARDLARGTIGALLLGMPLLYTMETWWLGWRLPAGLLLAYALGGLGVVMVAVHHVGFHERGVERDRSALAQLGDFLELLASSLAAALVVLALFGIVAWGDRPEQVVRLALVQVVPLGLGAAITNRALAHAEGDASSHGFRGEMATFAVGALFFSFPAAPTEEMQLIAAHAGPWRLALVVVASLLLTYLALYVLEFRGKAGRAQAMGSRTLQFGETAAGYVLALLLSALLLAGFGHFQGVTFHEGVQLTIVLGLLASLGGAAARVVV